MRKMIKYFLSLILFDSSERKFAARGVVTDKIGINLWDKLLDVRSGIPPSAKRPPKPGAARGMKQARSNKSCHSRLRRFFKYIFFHVLLC